MRDLKSQAVSWYGWLYLFILCSLVMVGKVWWQVLLLKTFWNVTFKMWHLPDRVLEWISQSNIQFHPKRYRIGKSDKCSDAPWNAFVGSDWSNLQNPPPKKKCSTYYLVRSSYFRIKFKGIGLITCSFFFLIYIFFIPNNIKKKKIILFKSPLS